MLKLNYILILVILLITAGCKDNEPVSYENPENRLELVYKFDNHIINTLILNKKYPSHIAMLSNGGKIFYSTDYGKEFVSQLHIGLWAISFDNVTTKLYIGTSGNGYVTPDFGQTRVEFINYGVLSFYPLNDTVMLFIKKDYLDLFYADLFWLNLQDYRWGRFIGLLDTFYNLGFQNVPPIYDISNTNKSGKLHIFFSEKYFGGIWHTEDYFNTFNSYHSRSNKHFIKHRLSSEGGLGLALVEDLDQSKKQLYITFDLFKNISLVENRILENFKINDFYILNEDEFIVSGVSLTDNISYLLLFRNKGTSYVELYKSEGEVTKLAFDSLNKWIYFIKISGNNSELYRYSLK